MRAPNLDHLLDFESRWDEALRAVLQPLGLPVFTGFDRATLEPPCLEAVFTFLGEAPAAGGTLPQVRAAAAPNMWSPVSYRGRALVQLHVHRGAQAPTTISAWRGGVRRLFLPGAQAFNPVTLPHYELCSVGLAEGDRLTDEGRDLDVVALRFDLLWAIRPDAWPA